jgi:drug/metabolite transporter (DMT)-like permease
MSTPSLFRLILLAAIWGASFLFMRIAAPLLGPVLLAELRAGVAAVFLLAVAVAFGKRLRWREHWRHHLVLGLLNSALPFLLFSAAAQSLSASLLSILNATAPIWGAAIGAVSLGTRLSRTASLGLGLGVGGVALLVGLDPASLRPGAGAAIAMGLAATFFYGIGSHYAKSAPAVEPFANAHGSMWGAALLIAPAVPFFSHPVEPSVTLALAVLGLGVVCSGVAYLLYFRLIADVGAASALTVTFLIPLFGVLWGHLVLGEPVGWNTLAGGGGVVLGAALVTGYRPWTSTRQGSVPDRSG